MAGFLLYGDGTLLWTTFTSSFALSSPTIANGLVYVSHAIPNEPPGNNGSMMVVGTPIKLTETPAGVYRRPPRLGEHTAEILGELRKRKERE